jgi:transcriptional regulator with XRE-family HTH domain
MVNVDTLHVELARRRLTQTRLALSLGRSPSTLSSWLRGAHPGPEDLAEQIERLLGIPRGGLSRPPKAS